MLKQLLGNVSQESSWRKSEIQRLLRSSSKLPAKYSQQHISVQDLLGDFIASRPTNYPKKKPLKPVSRKESFRGMSSSISTLIIPLRSPQYQRNIDPLSRLCIGQKCKSTASTIVVLDGYTDAKTRKGKKPRMSGKCTASLRNVPSRKPSNDLGSIKTIKLAKTSKTPNISISKNRLIFEQGLDEKLSKRFINKPKRIRTCTNSNCPSPLCILPEESCGASKKKTKKKRKTTKTIRIKPKGLNQDLDVL